MNNICNRIVVLLILTGVLPAFSASTNLSRANADFSFRLLKEIAKEQPNRNVFISPYGVSAVLQMACNGAAGETKNEIARVLATEGLAQDVINRANLEMQNALENTNGDALLSTANAMWCQKDIPINPQFIALNQQFFLAKVANSDFRDPKSANLINAWAAEKTHGRIPAIINGALDPATAMVLANAVYFKGKWEEPFEVQNTKDLTFHSRKGDGKIPMMQQGRKFDYRKGTGYQAVRLQYQGGQLAMYVFLPDENSSPEKLLNIMTGNAWQRITKPGFTNRRGTLVLPKLKMDHSTGLNQSLQALGIKQAFGQKANFSGISSQPLFISSALQRTFVEVDEKGTEATAVTVATMNAASFAVEPEKPFQMVVDRPYMFLIEEQTTGTILFMGVIVDPAAQ